MSSSSSIAFDEHLRRDLGERLLQLLVVLQRLGTDVLLMRGARAICRSSSSVFVMMSPFTFTSTCSMICGDDAWRGDRGRHRRQQTARARQPATEPFELVHLIQSLNFCNTIF